MDGWALDLGMRAMNAVHRSVMSITGNRLGWSAMKMPVLALETIGRRSGQPHTVMLTSPLQVGSAYVVVASKGGSDHHPAWFLNLRDQPVVSVSVRGGDPQPRIARIAEPDERSRLWATISATHKNYAGYQAKTDRELPLVVLEPPPD